MTRKKSGLTVVEGGAGGGPPGSVTKKSAQLIGNFEVPYAYEVWADGLYHINTITPDDPSQPSLRATPSPARRGDLRAVTHQPLWIRRFGRVLDADEQLVEIAFRDPISEEICTVWADRLQIASKLSILQLSKKGVPVNEGNAQAVITFLDAALNLNGSKLECVQVLGRSGAYALPEGTGWLIGERWIGPPNTRVAPDPRNRISLTRGFTVSGDEDAWFSMFKNVASQGPITRWLTYATFAAPLLRLVRQRTFIIHHWGDSGFGKTALAKFAMSAWGDPNALMQHFNRTEKSFTEIFEYMSDVPVLFDELQATDRDTVAKVIYWLCQEKKRGRSTTIGGLQDDGSEGWKSIVRMTGEESIIGKGGAIDLGGQANRVVQINSSVMTEQLAQEVHQWLERRHFGWGGMRFLEKLSYVMSTNAAQFPVVVAERYQQIRTGILQRVSAAPVHARVAHLTTVALAEYLANRWLFSAEPELALEGAIADAVAVAETVAADEVRESVAEQALQLFQDHFQAHRQAWFDLAEEADKKAVEDGRYKGLAGVVTPDEVWLIQQSANNILRQANLPPRRVWTDLRRLHILYTPPSVTGSFGVARKYGKFYAKVYVLQRKPAGSGRGYQPGSLLECTKSV